MRVVIPPFSDPTLIIMPSMGLLLCQVLLLYFRRLRHGEQVAIHSSNRGPTMSQGLLSTAAIGSQEHATVGPASNSGFVFPS